MGKCSIKSFKALGPMVRRDSFVVSGTPGAMRVVGVKSGKRCVFTMPSVAVETGKQMQTILTYRACSAISRSACFLSYLRPRFLGYFLRQWKVHTSRQISLLFCASRLTTRTALTSGQWSGEEGTHFCQELTSHILSIMIIEDAYCAQVVFRKELFFIFESTICRF